MNVSVVSIEHVYSLFNDELESHPIVVQIATITVLTFLGDVLSQLTFQRKPFSVKQAAIFFVIGLCYTGPLVVSWFAFVEWLVVVEGAASLVIKVALGEFLFTPIFVFVFMLVHGVLHWHTWKEIQESVRVKYISILTTRCVVYPVAQLVNFWIVPVNYRPMYSSLLALFWSVYLSWKANRAESMLDQKKSGEEDDCM